MLKRVGQIFALFFLLSFLTIFQLSLISALPDGFRQLNLILIILLLILFFLDFYVSLISVLMAGFWFDILSFNFFGFYLIIFFCTICLAQWILKNWLTNRSLYALLALMVSMTLFYNFLAAIILYLFGADYNNIFLVQASFWKTLAYQSAWSILSGLILFNLAALVSKRIKPFFLQKKSFI